MMTGKHKTEAASPLEGLVTPEFAWHGTYALSVGLGFPPSWSDCGSEGLGVKVRLGSDLVVRPGMVFHVLTSPRLPMKFGMGFSDTVLVTEEGCEVLTGVPRQLVIK